MPHVKFFIINLGNIMITGKIILTIRKWILIKQGTVILFFSTGS